MRRSLDFVASACKEGDENDEGSQEEGIEDDSKDEITGELKIAGKYNFHC